MDSWQVADVVQNARGGTKSANILSNGQPPTKRLATPSSPLYSPYGISSFDPSSTRQSLDFNVPPDLAEWLQKLDDWAFKTLLKESPRFFKRQVSEQELTLMFQSCIKKHSKGDTQYNDSVRTKFSKGKLKLWSFDHQPREAPVDFRHCDLVGMVQVRCFWFSGSQCGVCLELGDLMCREQTRDCPFLDSLDFLD